MASGRKPRISLPPELNAIDEAWGEDEQTTLPRPSRVPTAPLRPDAPGLTFIPPAPTGIELESVEDDAQDRETTIPKIPLDEYAQSMMSQDSQRAATQPPPARDVAEFDPEFRLDLGPHADARFSDHEKSTAVLHASQMPTAPPPVGFDPERTRTMPERAESRPQEPNHLPTNMELDLDSELPRKFSSRPPSSPTGHKRDHQVMKDRFAMGDFSGALEVSERIQMKFPNDAEARSLGEKCREVLLDMYSSRINGLERVPRIAMTPDQIRWLSLDHRAGFLLSMIDGISSIDDLLDVSGMQRLDALRILCSLLDQKVIQLS